MDLKPSLSLLPLILVAACATTEESVEVHEHTTPHQHAAPSNATAAAPAAATKSYDKPGFVTDVVDGRLWIFRSDSDALATYRSTGEPAKHVIKPGAGPNGMTVKAPDVETIQEYMVVAPGFATFVVDGRLWVFAEGDEAIAEFLQVGEPAKHVIRVGAGPMRMTVKSSDNATIDAYLAAVGI